MTGSLRGAHHENRTNAQTAVGPRRLRGRWSWDDRGASAVEYALILVAFALGLIVVGAALKNTVGDALASQAGAIENGAANAGCTDDGDGDGADSGSCSDSDGDGSGDGSGDGGPTQPAGSTAVAPGATATFTAGVDSGYSLKTPTSSACSYSPSISPQSASISAAQTTSNGTAQTVKFTVTSGASHGQAITATCTFKKGSSTTTKSYSIWIS